MPARQPGEALWVYHCRRVAWRARHDDITGSNTGASMI